MVFNILYMNVSYMQNEFIIWNYYFKIIFNSHISITSVMQIWDKNQRLLLVTIVTSPLLVISNNSYYI